MRPSATPIRTPVAQPPGSNAVSNHKSMRGRPRRLCLDILAERREDSEMVRPDRLWRNARLATMTGDGLGVVEGGEVAAAGGRLAYAGTAAGWPSDRDAEIGEASRRGRWARYG